MSDHVPQSGAVLDTPDTTAQPAAQQALPVEAMHAIDPGAPSVEDRASAPVPPPAPPRRAMQQISDGIRYVYLMRFSLMLWLAMIVLAWADAYTGNASMTRGILTPFSPSQWFFTGLSVTLPGWFALLAARIVCAYGHARFGLEPPKWFQVHDRMQWFAFWGAQIPGALLLWRIAYNVGHEGESSSYLTVSAFLLLGALTALVFWYIVSILYYWIWDPESTIPVRAFLVPHWNPIPLEEIQDISCGSSLRFFSRALNLLGRLGQGYCVASDRPPLHLRTAPGHIVATISLLCALFLYLLLMPISAPVHLPALAWIGRASSLLLAGYLTTEFIVPACRGLWPAKGKAHAAASEPTVETRPASKHKQISRRARSLPLIAAMIMLAPVALGIASPDAPRAIPVIAYVIVLLVVVFWSLAGVAFFLDHFRVPVLTLTAALILGLNHWPAEHVFPARPIDAALTHEPLKGPPDFVERVAFHGTATDDEPVVIITATGGGIHAAAWTATSLHAVNDAFHDAGIQLPEHILLMSAVSGGSVATAGFLREYFTGANFDASSFQRLEASASCSSLQAVAWGLAYPDTMRLLLPPAFNAYPYLDRFDRGWALQKAIDRNLHDSYCIPQDAVRNQSGPSLANLSLNTLSRLDPNGELCRTHKEACAHFPAFTLNSTVVETGDRFLLSNYSVFATKEGTDEVQPAASFLGVYGRETILPLPSPPPVPGRGGFADISILTAARLSASFTYVSPATRLPFAEADHTFGNAYHFVDGGYYDNDGTNSAIEFLKAASPAFSPQHPLRVLLLEIRNAWDLPARDSPDGYAYQSGMQWDPVARKWTFPSTARKQRFGPIGQLLAPPEAAKNAGFGSTTSRNRRELDTLARAYCGSLDLHHVVLDYQPAMRVDSDGRTVLEGESEMDQPLSWHLTHRQREWISGANAYDGKDHYALDRKQPRSDREAIQEAVRWFKDAQTHGRDPIEPAETCKRPNLDSDAAPPPQ